jgi:MFS family permease
MLRLGRGTAQDSARSAAATGWWALGGAFVGFAVSGGIMHAYTVFFVAFLEEFGWNRAETSLAYAVAQLMSGASAPLIGLLVDRVGPRMLILGGGSLLIGGLLLSASVAALWHLVLLYGVVMTVGANGLGLVVSVPLLSRLFVRKRGMAVALVQSANGLGRAVSAPLVQLVIAALGWRQSYLVLAAVMAVCLGPVAWCFPRREPERRVPAPSESAGPAGGRPAGAAAPAVQDWRVRDAMRTPHFWLLGSVYLCTGLGSFFVSLHQLAFAVDMGFDKLYAASVLGIGSFLAIGGIIGTGTLSDYIGRELAAILAYGISILGVVCALLITGPEQRWLLWLHACCFGLTWGARGPSITAKTVDLFPGRHLGAILGGISIGTGLGAAIGSWASGWIFDRSGSYHLAFLLSIASYLVGCVAFWRLRRPPVRHGHAG